MADKRIYQLTTLAAYDQTYFIEVDKEGQAESRKIALSTIVGLMAYTEQNYVSNGQNLTASIDALDKAVEANAVGIENNSLKIGTQTYTEQNYVADGESLSESVDALDQAVKVNEGAISEIRDTVTGLTDILVVQRTISPAEINALHTVEKTVLATPTSVLSVYELISISADMQHNGTNYETNGGKIQLFYKDETVPIIEFDEAFIESESRGQARGAFLANSRMVAGKAIVAKTPEAITGNGGQVKLYITYKLNTLDEIAE